MDPKIDHAEPTRRLPVFALLGATALSMMGNVLTFVAIPWFVLQTTGSATKMGIVGETETLAAVLAGLFGGPIVDRFGFRRASVLADLMGGVTVAAIPLLHGTVGLAFWQLLSLVFLGALLDTPGVTGRQSLIPDLSRMAGAPVERANSAYQAIVRSSYLFGPPLAGVLIVLMGLSNVLLLDAATFAVSATVIAAAVPRPAPAPAAGGGPGGYLTELFEGLGSAAGACGGRRLLPAGDARHAAQPGAQADGRPGLRQTGTRRPASRTGPGTLRRGQRASIAQETRGAAFGAEHVAAPPTKPPLQARHQKASVRGLAQEGRGTAASVYCNRL